MIFTKRDLRDVGLCFLVALIAVLWMARDADGQTNGQILNPSGDVQAQMGLGGGAFSGPICFPDDIGIYFGGVCTAPDAGMLWDTAGVDQFQVWLTDCDGGGTDCAPMYWTIGIGGIAATFIAGDLDSTWDGTWWDVADNVAGALIFNCGYGELMSLNTATGNEYVNIDRLNIGAFGALASATYPVVIVPSISASTTGAPILMSAAITASGANASGWQPITVTSEGVTLTGGATNHVTTMTVTEPDITESGGTATIASSLRVLNAPTEGNENWALYIEQGDLCLANGNVTSKVDETWTLADDTVYGITFTSSGAPANGILRVSTENGDEKTIFFADGVKYSGNTSHMKFESLKSGLTDAGVNAFVRVAVSQGDHVGGSIIYSIHADDGADYQTRNGTLTFAAVNKAGAETCDVQVGAASEAVAVSAGTLVSSFSCTSTVADTVDIRVTPNSSLVPTLLEIHYHVMLDHGFEITPL